MKTLLVLALSAAAALPLSAQAPSKRPLNHGDYDRWESLRGQTLSDDGRWAAYAVNPVVGDGRLEVVELDGERRHTLERGGSPRFSPDSKWMVFRIAAKHADELAYKRAKLKQFKHLGKKERPESQNAMLNLETGEIEVLKDVGTWRLGGQDGAWLAYQVNEKKKKDEKKKEKPAKSEGAEKPAKSEGAEKPAKSEGAEKPAKPEGAEKPAKPEGAEKPAKPEGGEAGKVAEETSSEEPAAERPRRRRAGGESSRRSGRRRGGWARRMTERMGGRLPEARAEAAAAKEPEKKEPKKRWRRDGKPLRVRDLSTGKETVIPGVTSFGFLAEDRYLWFATNSVKDDPMIERGLFVHELATGKRTRLVEGAAKFSSLSTDREHTVLAFFSDRNDREAKKPESEIWTWDFEAKAAKPTIGSKLVRDFPAQHRVRSGRLSFSRDGSVMLFGLEETPKEKDDEPEILAESKVELDLWHWKDPMLQPMQKLRGRGGRGRFGRGGGSSGVTCVWHRDGERMVVLSRNKDESVRLMTPDGSRALVTDSSPYAMEVSWDGRYSDVSVMNTLDGSRRRLVTKVRGFVRNSPEGRWLLWFQNGHWHRCDVVTGEHRNLTANLKVRFDIEDWDTPQPASAYGSGGWTEHDEHVLLYDSHDVWMVAMRDGEANCVTDGFGRLNDLRLRIERLDTETPHVAWNESLLLRATDQETKASGYYHDVLGKLGKPKRLVMKDMAFGRRLSKAEDADVVLFTLSTFEGQDLWVSDLGFEKMRKLSALNPQQKEVRWGKAELVRWHSADGIPLQGILIKPEGFDPKKKYPMMVYFYEKLSNSLHSYRTPSAGTSPNASYYVSNGYLWFMPDIVYREGYPGESALKCIVPGIQSLVQKGFVDPSAIGAAGHSWGGYQTAYLVTRTDLFAAVESGAPVSNMTSAYGGIRWGSGMSRAFQYEKTQSRIGGSLWEYPMRYLENSPLFSADKVNTPVLMLHNDEDGAVPWYQGIEYFCALRRLDKEVYMFNYVGGGHGLRKKANRVDWTMRMQQYFDHHLKGAPAPEWMRRGVPYAEREDEKLRFNPPAEITEAPAPAAKKESPPAAASATASDG